MNRPGKPGGDSPTDDLTPPEWMNDIPPPESPDDYMKGKPMSRGEDKYDTFYGTLEAETAKAIMFQADGWREAEWIPKSQCHVEMDSGSQENRVIVEIKQWLCKKNGWEGE